MKTNYSVKLNYSVLESYRDELQEYVIKSRRFHLKIEGDLHVTFT